MNTKIKTVTDVLRYGQYTRIDMDNNRWMFFQSGNWVVYEKLKYARHGKEIIRTASEEEAVQELIKGSDLF